MKKTLIWDLPTRIFHWLLVMAFVVAWISYDDNRFLFFHVFAGYTFLGLFVFRLVWGVIGTHYARFHSFAYDWKSVTAYLIGLLNGKAMRHIGHNPAGGWAIFLLLVLGLLMSIAGVLVLSGEEGHGSFTGLVSFSVGILAREVHKILAWAMLGLITIHVVGVIVESVIHKENLVWAMITGQKEAAAGVARVRGHHLLGLAMVAFVVISSLVYFRGYLEETADHLYQPFQGPVLPDNALWREECGDCHFAFHPTLLPERSWIRIFADQHEHFGDDLDLDHDTLTELLEFHKKYSSESQLTEPARKILYYTPEGETPIRVTETHYWIKKHKNISEVHWKNEKVGTKSNCSACHLDSERGTYEDSNMRLPD